MADAELPVPVPAPAPSLAGGPPQQHRRWRSSELLGNAPEIEIEHGHTVYRLRQTSLGKLILTK